MMDFWYYIIAGLGLVTAAFFFIRFRERDARLSALRHEVLVRQASTTLAALKADIALNETRITEQIAAEKGRKWLNEGITSLNDLIVSNRDSLCQMTQEFVNKLCDYTGASCAAIWLIGEDNGTPMLNEFGRYGLQSCDNSKFMVGEGLVGTCFREAQAIPVGHTTNRFFPGMENAFVYLYPVKMEEIVVGVLEVVYSQAIRNNTIKLLISVLENMATTINVIEINTRNDKLIAETTRQAEDVRLQDKELRQKLEEMRFMEEDALRRQKELETTIEEYRKDEKNYDQELRKLRKRVKMLEVQHAKLIKTNEKLKGAGV